MLAPGYPSRSTDTTLGVTLAIHPKVSMTPEGHNEAILQYLHTQDVSIMVSSMPTAPATESSVRRLCSFKKFFLFYIGVELINNVLVSCVQASDSVTYIHVSVLRWLYSVPPKPHCLPVAATWARDGWYPDVAWDPRYKPVSVETWTRKSWRNEMGGAGWEVMWLEGPQGIRDAWRAWWERRNQEVVGGCMQVVQPTREGRKAAGVGLSRPNDARLC